MTTEAEVVTKEFGATAVLPDAVMAAVITPSGEMLIYRDYIIDSQEAVEAVNASLKSIKAEKDWLESERKKISDPLHKAWTALNGFFARGIRPREEAETFLKGLLIGWQTKQEEARREAERQRQAEEVKRRQEQEQAAARERARAEEAAAAQRRAAEEAEQRRVAALAANDPKAAAKAAGEAAAALEKAEATVETAETKIAQREAAAPVVATVAPEAAKISGFSVRSKWRGRLKGITEQEQQASMLALIKAAASDPQAAALLMLDQKSLDRLADALKKNLTIPGIEAYEDKTASSRASRAA